MARHFNNTTADWIDCGNGVRASDIIGILAMAWVNLDASPTSNQAVVCRWDDTTGEQWLLNIGTGQKVGWTILDSSLNGHGLAGSIAITPGVWTHVAGMFTGSQMVTFVNGAVDTTASLTNAINHATSTHVTIGRQGDAAAPFKGSIAEVSLVLVNTSITSAAQYEATVKACAQGGTPSNTETMYGTQHMQYWPLLGDSPEPSYPPPNAGTVHGTTVTPHPPVRVLNASRIDG